MNVLITGGVGFIGCHLARYHLQRGDSVIIVDNLFKTDVKVDEAFRVLMRTPGFEYLQMDLTKPIGKRMCLSTLDIVYHLAAINGTQLFYEIPYQVARANLLMTLNLLDALKDESVRKLVYASTSEVYADCDQVGLLHIPTDELIPVVFCQPTDKRFSYGTSKFMGEFLCFHFGQQFSIPTSIVRYHNVYGPRMGSRHVIPQFIARIQAEENPFGIYGGQETRSFCYIDDAVEASYLVATTPNCDDEILHVGNSAEEITIEELARRMMGRLGKEFEIVELGRRSASVSRRCPDISKLSKLTGFQPNVNLQKGLSRTLEWYLAHSLSSER